jgi:integrase/recombinase XerD
MGGVKKILTAAEYSKEFKRSNTKTYRLRRPTASRDTAIILMLLDTGMRIGELCRLRVQDVNLQTGEVFICPFSTGRKTKSRTVQLGAGSKRAVWLYLAKLPEPKSNQSLINIDQRPINKFMKEIEKRSGVKDIHPHRFRHTFAIQYLRNGGDIYTLQRILGHSTLDMCLRYLHLVQADVTNAHRKASPVDNWKL